MDRVIPGDINMEILTILGARSQFVKAASFSRCVRKGTGLQSFNLQMHQETSRVLTDHISTLLFALTSTPTKNLQREGIALDKVSLVGDIIHRASQLYFVVGLNRVGRTLRDGFEMEAGWSQLVDVENEEICQVILGGFGSEDEDLEIWGDGQTAQKIFRVY